MVERSPNTAGELLRRPRRSPNDRGDSATSCSPVGGRFHSAASLSSRRVSAPGVLDIASPCGAATASSPSASNLNTTPRAVLRRVRVIERAAEVGVTRRLSRGRRLSHELLALVSPGARYGLSALLPKDRRVKGVATPPSFRGPESPYRASTCSGGRSRTSIEGSKGPRLAVRPPRTGSRLCRVLCRVDRGTRPAPPRRTSPPAPGRGPRRVPGR